MTQTVVTMDNRRRVNLAKLAPKEHERYLVSVEDDGRIILDPVEVITLNKLKELQDVVTQS